MTTATTANRGWVFWAPRLLTMAYVALLSLFALDAFGGNEDFWPTVLAFLIHMIPMLTIVAVLVLAWRREWIGAVFFGIFALGFVLGPLAPPHVRRSAFSQRLLIDLTVAGPALATAVLFFAGWVRRLRGAEPD